MRTKAKSLLTAQWVLTLPKTHLRFSHLLLLLLLFSASAAQWGCASQGASQAEVSVAVADKIKGVSFVAPPKKIDQGAIRPVAEVRANYMSVIPYSFCPVDSPALLYNAQFQWWGERTVGVIRTIELAHEQGIEVMLKPQIWLRHGTYTGTLEFENDEKWARWEKDFRSYILHFANIADSMNVPLFCIGTELKLSIAQRPQFWTKLIEEVREIYSGKITYAANWDDYKEVPFWSSLDYIGVDAYFPLSDDKKPKLDDISKEWEKWGRILEQVSRKHGKPILFTEAGYRSAQYGLKEPWVVSRKAPLDLETQRLGYEALFNTVWKEDWMAGMFLWKWFSNDEGINQKDNDFSPQNKPAEELIREHYSK